MSKVFGYPEYDEIVNQYYNGMVLNWSTEDIREHNLCYLAGYETGVAQIGYCARIRPLPMKVPAELQCPSGDIMILFPVSCC